MQGLEIKEARMPYVTFEVRAVEDREATERNGAYSTKDVEFVLVTPMGSKDRLEFLYSEWIADMEREVNAKRLDPEWLQSYKRRYRAWKEGQEMPVEGTPLRNWPMISPAQLKNLQALHVVTLEQLASANEELIKRIGMGGRDLQIKAVEWIKGSQDIGKVVTRLAALETKTVALEEQNQLLTEQNNYLRQFAPRQKTAEFEEVDSPSGLTTERQSL